MDDTEDREESLAKDCLALVQQGMAELRRGNFESSTKLLGIALHATQSMTEEEAQSLFPLALCHLCLLRSRQGNDEEATRLREMAMPLVESIATPMESVTYHYLMAEVLVELKEYRRAIPFWEQALQLGLELNEPVAMADLLSRSGRCYAMCGLKEHAAILLRSALKIFRDYPADPRLPALLISLGNALRKSSPTEAEAFYKEAAEIHVAKAQLESATTAWVNLGITCSEQGRQEESLAYYEKALHVRERIPSTHPSRIGVLLNNMANCYRRMRKFDEAMRLIDRASEILRSADDVELASAYGTRGLIFQDDERDADALEWLQRSYAQREKVPSPNIDSLAENLEYQLTSLKRLGRLDEVAAAEAQITSLRAAKKDVPQASIDMSALTAEPEGAVLIELGFGSRPGGKYGLDDAELIREQLSEIVRREEVGSYRGRVTIPESVTIILYGPDAEALFRAVEPFLLDHSICDGALVTIRQGSQFREVVLPCALN
jgi:tetratricopeptide (TPR) repeat protein